MKSNWQKAKFFKYKYLERTLSLPVAGQTFLNVCAKVLLVFLTGRKTRTQFWVERLSWIEIFHVLNEVQMWKPLSIWYWQYMWYILFLTFPACFSIPIIFSNFNYDCSIFLDVRNLQEQVKKALCYQKLFWPFTVWINRSSDLKNFANSWPSASNFKSFSHH